MTASCDESMDMANGRTDHEQSKICQMIAETEGTVDFVRF
jgi:hypothetical protein